MRLKPSVPPAATVIALAAARVPVVPPAPIVSMPPLIATPPVRPVPVPARASVPVPDLVSPVEPVSVLAIVAVTPEATVIALAAWLLPRSAIVPPDTV